MSTLALPHPLLAQPRLRDRALAWWLVASVAAHGLLVHWLPGWRLAEDRAPPPLQVELRQPQQPAEIIPPKPLPVQTQPPQSAARPKPAAEKPLAPVRETPQPVTQPVAPPAPILTAPPEAPPAPAAAVAPEQRPAPPPPPEPSRTAAPPPPPAPVTAPIFDAAYLNNPKPAYPMVAMRRGESGTVYVLVLVTKEGRPARVSVQKSSGSSSLDEAAVRAINGWRFTPARKGTQAVDGEVVVPMVFDIREAR